MVVALNVALAPPILTVAKAAVPGRLEDVRRRVTLWPLVKVPATLVNGPPLMLYSPPCTLIGALLPPERMTPTVLETTSAPRGTSTASMKANGAGTAAALLMGVLAL